MHIIYCSKCGWPIMPTEDPKASCMCRHLSTHVPDKPEPPLMRHLKDGDQPCGFCGDSRRRHRDGTRQHPFVGSRLEEWFKRRVRNFLFH